MTSICQELSESDVKIVLVNNGTTLVFLSLMPSRAEGILKCLSNATLSRVSGFIKLFDSA